MSFRRPRGRFEGEFHLVLKIAHLHFYVTNLTTGRATEAVAARAETNMLEAYRDLAGPAYP